jgi:excisionase family DNA binding protein
MGEQYVKTAIGKKDVLTTGQVARICNVAPRTVSKWFDSGQLRGYRIPGSKDRRIPLQSLVRFMKAHGIPLNGLETGQTRLLLVDSDADIADLLTASLSADDGYEVRTARSAFEAGMMFESYRPHVVLLDVSLSDIDAISVTRLTALHPELQDMRLIAMGASISEGEAQAFKQQGFAGVLHKPFDMRQLIHAIEDALAGA